jgi:glyoxylase-like metal-dependent hydrolase (beta-lactamase superfamily II)
VAEPQPYELYAIRYASARRSAAEVFVGGDPHDAGLQMDYFVWLARNRERIVVVDTGFDEPAARRRGRELTRRPGESLRMLGVDPGAVEDVILTHLHYDHAGNLDLFPRATFHVQDREIAYATGRYMAEPFFAQAYDLEHVLSAVRLTYAGRIRYHDGTDEEVAPGISVHHIGGHTRGLQVVRVWTQIGWVVLASDAVHFLANRDSCRPFPILADATEMIDGWKRIRRLADTADYIVPGHDPLVMSRYRPPRPELEGIVVRLDEEPRRSG